MPRYGVSNARTPWTYGNMRELRETAGSCGLELEEMEISEVRARTVSAATMPPIEWPIRIV
jgi:hypothetical protein